MPIMDLFSKRMKVERGEVPDVYQYDNFDEALKVKVVYIIQDAFIKVAFSDYEGSAYKSIIEILCREYGVFELFSGGSRERPSDHLFDYFLNAPDIEKALDVVELSVKMLEEIKAQYHVWEEGEIFLNEAIQELNDRFQEEGFGYKYESGMIMKITTEYTHNEIVKPALNVLSDKRFAGAQQEFLSAHKHFREHENKECIADCLKSFESTMKVICKTKKYKVDAAASANKLITALSENNYMPNYLDSQFNALKQLLSCGIPTIRNNLAGHGQGEVIKDVDDNYAGYALNITASNIVFLVSLLKDSK
ncbi:MAG: hypothetical protein Ta2B_18090 [Termitinemataceae bacterium]|nr:MAG: hypothetical protein Ta2B_18090 [Termitinemataceae bacterium]